MSGMAEWVGTVAALSLAGCAAPLEPATPAPQPEPVVAEVDPDVLQTEQGWLVTTLEEIREEHGLPAIGAVILRPDGHEVGAVTGKRNANEPDVAMADDPWHIGSNGKSMSALVAARLADQGLLSLDSTLGEIFPELSKGWGEAARAITVTQLATHTSGLRDTAVGPSLMRWHMLKGDMAAHRRTETDALLRAGPEKAPSDGFAYANANYLILGAVIEKVSGKPFETVMQEHLFTPLGMASAGFGAPLYEGGAPWGHTVLSDKLNPVDPGQMGSDNPAVMAAAGTMHMSLRDWGRYAREVMRGARGQGSLLSAETYRAILTPPSQPGYAYGWGVREVPGIGRVMMHNGSNTMWFATARLFPDRKAGYQVVTNVAGKRAEAAMQDAVAKIEGRLAEKFGRSE